MVRRNDGAFGSVRRMCRTQMRSDVSSPCFSCISKNLTSVTSDGNISRIFNARCSSDLVQSKRQYCHLGTVVS